MSENVGVMLDGNMVHDIDTIISSCHLIPRFGTNYHPAKWDTDTVLEECKSFFLNKYLTIQTFFDLEQHLHI